MTVAERHLTREIAVRAVSAVASLGVGVIGVVAFASPPDQGVVAGPLGYATLIVPALTRSARCWVALDGPTGVEYQSVDQLPDQLDAGQVGAGRDGGVPSAGAFPAALLLAGSAVLVAIRSSARA